MRINICFNQLVKYTNWNGTAKAQAKAEMV